MAEDHSAGRMAILPPAPGRCVWCAVDHPPGGPHNFDSLYYHVVFLNTYGRDPTWADALAHCTPELRQHWRVELFSYAGIVVPPDSAYMAPVRRVDPVAEGPGEDDIPDTGQRRLLNRLKTKREAR